MLVIEFLVKIATFFLICRFLGYLSRILVLSYGVISHITDNEVVKRPMVDEQAVISKETVLF
jgi:hypothetical protein